MKKHLFFRVAFVFSYACNYGMDAPPSPPLQIKECKAPCPIDSIACGRRGQIVICRTQKCFIIDFNGKIRKELTVDSRRSSGSYIHPYSPQLIIGMPVCGQKIWLWSSNPQLCDSLRVSSKLTSRPCLSNILFREESYFFIDADDRLVECNFGSPSQIRQFPMKSENCGKLIQVNESFSMWVYPEDWHGHFNHIFMYPSKKNSSFLCSDSVGGNIYKAYKKKNHFIAKKLLHLDLGDDRMDETAWAYSDLGYIFGITYNTQKLYVINTKKLKKLKQHYYVGDEDINNGKAYAVAVHPNQRIFALLLKSENEKIWKIHLVDSKTWLPIVKMNLTTESVSMNVGHSRLNSGQFIAFTPYGRKMIVAIPGTKCFFICKIPPLVSGIDVWEKYVWKKFPFIRYFNFPKDLRDLIARFLFMSIAKYPKKYPTA